MIDFYNPDSFRFEMKTIGERNKVMKYLELRAGFDTHIIEDASDFKVKIGKDKKYAEGIIQENKWKHRT